MCVLWTVSAVRAKGLSSRQPLQDKLDQDGGVVPLRDLCINVQCVIQGKKFSLQCFVLNFLRLYCFDKFVCSDTRPNLPSTKSPLCEKYEIVCLLLAPLYKLSGLLDYTTVLR